MRIAVIVKSFPVVSETFILRQVTGLIDRGHEVDIYARTRPISGEPEHTAVSKYNLLARTTYVDELVPAESPYWQMPVRPLLGETWIPGAVKPIRNSRRAIAAIPTLVRCAVVAPRLTMQSLDSREYNGAAQNLTALYYLGVLVRQRKSYDIVHIHYGPVANLFRFAGRLFDAPLIVSFHGYDVTKHPRGADATYARLFSTADRITVNSARARSHLEALGCPPRKITQLNYGIDPDEFAYHRRTRKPGEPVRLLSVARLVEKKGLEYAIRAVAAIRSKYADVRYEIVGEGNLRAELQQLIDGLGLSRIVTLLGARNGDQVKNLMNAAHIFLLPSVTASDGDQEGTPVTLLEAQATGMPVVSTFHSGIPEVVLHERSGLLVPERDVDSLANAVNLLISRVDLWEAFGRAGSKHISDCYNIHRLNDDLVDLYRRAGHKTT